MIEFIMLIIIILIGINMPMNIYTAIFCIFMAGYSFANWGKENE